MNRITTLYQLDLLFKNCKGCSHNSENGSPEIRCKGCSFYPQIRWIGDQLGRKKQMGKLEMTVDEFIDMNYVKKLPITKIAHLKGVAEPTIHYWKNQRKEQINNAVKQLKQDDTAEIKQKECTCKGKEEVAKYEQEITNLKASCEDLENENAKLRESKNNLLTEYNKLQEAVYNNSYHTENQKKRIEDLGKTLALYERENKAMRELLSIWI